MRISRKRKGLVRGVPSAVFLSALFHFVLLVIAGGFVVFTVVTKGGKKFTPPAPVERQKMDLKKPRVKVKKTVKPRASSRITAKNVRQSMPEIALPEVSSFGNGLTGGIGGFEMMPDPQELSMFGGTKSIAVGNDFEGTFYSLEYDRRGKDLDMDDIRYIKKLRQFVDSGWNPNVFAPYYRSPRKLYATQIMIPPISSEFGPSQFGMGFGPSFDPIHWCIHYKGKFASKTDGRFRFCGLGDDTLLVRVNGNVVLNAGWGGPTHYYQTVSEFRNSSPDDRKYLLGTGQMYVGDWVELKAHEPNDIEILIGETPGGIYTAMLMIQQEGVKYPRNQGGGPILPVFKTAEIPEQVIKQIQYTLIEGEADLYSDLMFNVN